MTRISRHVLVQTLADIYPDSLHVRDIGLRDAEDSVIWLYAAQHDFTIVSKDSDFQQRSLLYGSPPKFIWLRIGNCPTKLIEGLLRRQSVAIHTFDVDPSRAHLMLP